jgi:hypothetical protein
MTRSPEFETFVRKLNRTIDYMTEAPPDQIAPKIVAKMKEKIAAGITADDMFAIIDECKEDGLASDFAIGAMRAIWKMLQVKEREESCA